MSRPELVVLKLGGSVLSGRGAIWTGVREVYRELSQGRRVVAVVSARGGVTERLVAEADELGAERAHPAYAALLASAEAHSAARLALALESCGVAASLVEAHRLGIATDGARWDADPVAVEPEAVASVLEHDEVAVVPGFVGAARDRMPSLLGRGGSDLTAILLAHALGADDCRLVKDVDGWYAADPAVVGSAPARYATLSWDDAVAGPAPVVQHKAVLHARRLGRSFLVTAPAGRGGTRVGPAATRLLPASPPPSPQRVALLGLGELGVEVYRFLAADPRRLATAVVLLGDLRRVPPTPVPRSLLTTRLDEALAVPAETVIEALGGGEVAARAVLSALELRRWVVTASAELVARCGAEPRAGTAGAGLRLAVPRVGRDARPRAVALALVTEIGSLESPAHGREAVPS